MPLHNSFVWNSIWSNRKLISDYEKKYYSLLFNFKEKLPKNSKILEAGCGTGRTLNLFKNNLTIGLDISNTAIKIAKRNADHVVMASIFDLPFKENTFALVYNSGVIEHFKHPNNIIAIREMGRVAKSYIIIIVPNFLCLWYFTFKIFYEKIKRKWKFGHEEPYTIFQLKKIVYEKTSLSIEKSFGLQVFPHSNDGEKKIYPQIIASVFDYIEKILPFKEIYAYAIGIVCKKRLES